MHFLNVTGMQDKSVELAYKALKNMVDECTDTIDQLVNARMDQSVIDAISQQRAAFMAARRDFSEFFGIKE